MPSQLLIILLLFSVAILPSKATGFPDGSIGKTKEELLEKYKIPDDHPIKPKLDKIFKKTRATFNLKSMKKAGFHPVTPQPVTQVIVTKHPKLKGYILKVYLDEQDYPNNRSEFFCWVDRIIGSKLIQTYITEHQYDHLFKVPKKWIYQLPDIPSSTPNPLQKNFILVEDDMNIVDETMNIVLWRSKLINPQRLKAFFEITTNLGLYDCTKPSNCSFSHDLRLAFIDTQIYHVSHIKYQMLTPYLSPSMKKYWKSLIKNKKR